jgi:hypothetical protein
VTRTDRSEGKRPNSGTEALQEGFRDELLVEDLRALISDPAPMPMGVASRVEASVRLERRRRRSMSPGETAVIASVASVLFFFGWPGPVTLLFCLTALLLVTAYALLIRRIARDIEVGDALAG